MWVVFDNLILTVPFTDVIRKSKDCFSKIENAGKNRANFTTVHRFFSIWRVLSYLFNYLFSYFRCELIIKYKIFMIFIHFAMFFSGFI